MILQIILIKTCNTILNVKKGTWGAHTSSKAQQLHYYFISTMIKKYSLYPLTKSWMQKFLAKTQLL